MCLPCATLYISPRRYNDVQDAVHSPYREAGKLAATAEDNATYEDGSVNILRRSLLSMSALG